MNVGRCMEDACENTTSIAIYFCKGEKIECPHLHGENIAFYSSCNFLLSFPSAYHD